MKDKKIITGYINKKKFNQTLIYNAFISFLAHLEVYFVIYTIKERLWYSFSTSFSIQFNTPTLYSFFSTFILRQFFWSIYQDKIWWSQFFGSQFFSWCKSNNCFSLLSITKLMWSNSGTRNWRTSIFKNWWKRFIRERN